MKLNNQDKKNTGIDIRLLSAFIFLYLCINLNAQTLEVKGRISTSTTPVQRALITFIDNSDTTRQFSTRSFSSGDYKISIITSGIQSGIQPTRFTLGQNYPNPFSSITTIPFGLGTSSDATITIYDVLGREVKKISSGPTSFGTHQVVWDGLNHFGVKAPAGLYFYRLQAGGKTLIRKMILGTDTGHYLMPPSQGFSFQTSRIINKPDHMVQGSDFSIRIENTALTNPMIVPMHISSVIIRNDTTLNFTVDPFPITATIYLDSTRQIIRGFGAANILLWNWPDMTDSEIQTAFGTAEGQLGFTILRLSLDADKNRWNQYVPTAKKAYDMGATIIAAPWYAPAEMVETVNDVSRVRYDMYDAYAAHLDSFGTYMAANGVPIYGISVQNEPEAESWTHWTPEEMFRFMKENAHAIEGTRVMAPESWSLKRVYSDPILNDSVACANTDIICGHIYGGGLGAYPLAEEKGKEVWMTEYLINSDNDGANMDTSWTANMQTVQTINDCMQSNMSAYVWWRLVRFYGPIADGTLARKGEVTKKGYAMSQFSRFIRPGYFRVECVTTPLSWTIFVTAYRDSESSKVVIVALNTDSTPGDLTIRLENGSMNGFIPYTTTQFKNVAQDDEIGVIDGEFTYTLEASSITTFVSK